MILKKFIILIYKMTKAQLRLAEFSSNATNQYAGFYMSNTNSNLLYYYSPSNGKTTGHCFVSATGSNSVRELFTIQGDGIVRVGSNSVGMSNGSLCIAPSLPDRAFISFRGAIGSGTACNIDTGKNHNVPYGDLLVYIDTVGFKRIHLYND